jgi:hypothetical protein
MLIYRNGYEFQVDFKRPFHRFLGGKPKRPRIPPAASPAPTPEQVDEEILQKDRAKRKQRLAQAGRGGTILTGGGLGGEKGKQTLLGGKMSNG